MFELLTDPHGAERGLHASDIAHWQTSLTTSLSTRSGLNDAERVEAIRALEELVCSATAAQAWLAAELDASIRSDAADAGVQTADTGKGVASLVALARRESPHRGQRHLGLATIVRDELPHTWSAWRAGHVTEWTATVVARETACLPLTHRLAVDEAVAGDRDRLESLGQRELIGLLRSEAERLDPASVVARRRQAESERRVTLRPAPDTMTYLTALLPVKDGVAVLTALTRAADVARSDGDPRSRGQVMADELVARAVGSTVGVSDRPHIGVELGLVMSDHALFGGADDGAHLEGAGYLPAELAREIVVGALTHDESVAIRRLYTDPETGSLVAMESTSRTFRGNLAKLIRLRDQVCRTPWCDAPIRHTDHATDASAGGPTSERNGQGLCEACNHAKTAHRWRAGPEPGGGISTVLPTGHSFVTRPPPLARVWERAVPRLTMDYVLAG